MNHFLEKRLALFPLRRWDASLLSLSIGLVVLNILDIILTLEILRHGGMELNPLVNMLIDLGVGYFVSLKLTAVILGVTVLCLCDKFIRTRGFLSVLFNLYSVLVLYEIFCYGVVI